MEGVLLLEFTFLFSTSGLTATILSVFAFATSGGRFLGTVEESTSLLSLCVEPCL